MPWSLCLLGMGLAGGGERAVIGAAGFTYDEVDAPDEGLGGRRWIFDLLKQHRRGTFAKPHRINPNRRERWGDMPRLAGIVETDDRDIAANDESATCRRQH